MTRNSAARTVVGIVAIAALVTACTSHTRAHSSRATSAATVPTSAPVTATPSTVTNPAPPQSCPTAGATTVSTAGSLTNALAHAKPGVVIILAPGIYRGNFVASGSGTASAPITLCGLRSAVLDGGNTTRGYVLHLDAASWWKVIGLTVQDGQKGVMTDHAEHNLLAGLDVHLIGDEAIHLRAFSSDNTVQDNVVSDTGHQQSKFGEGIYVGTAHKNWCKESNCQPDQSDRNVIRGNTISRTTAENIDIKEGTTGGVIAGNRLSGVGMDSSAATAWINVKGNSWTIEDNVGVTSVKDGFQVHEVSPGWGEHNIFRANHATVNGPGWAFYVQRKSLQALIACSNTETGAGAGLSNIACSSG